MEMIEAKTSPKIGPYYSIGAFYKERFGHRVYKVSVNLAENCPNRLGLKGMQTCIFCDEWGSAAYPENQQQSIERQLSSTKERLRHRYKVDRFLIYFQAYTTTFLSLKRLEKAIEVALADPEVMGVVIGTRPDCLSKAVLEYLAKLKQRTYLCVELGVQSLNDRQLEFLRRGHSAQDSLNAIQELHQRGIEVGVHLMFGLPGESDASVAMTARLLSQQEVKQVKLHNLHVLKNTPLESLYRDKQFVPIDFETYRQRVVAFLLHLAPDVAVHRLHAVASRWEELVAPQWTRHKMKITQAIVDYMTENNLKQGQKRKRYAIRG